MIERKKIEKRLNEFPTLDYKIKGLELKLEKQKLKGSPRDISAVDFSRVGHGSGGTQSAQVILADVQNTIHQINELKIEKEFINGFNELIKKGNEKEYQFLNAYFYDKKSINEILDELNYSYNSANSLYRIKDGIILKFDKYINFE